MRKNKQWFAGIIAGLTLVAGLCGSGWAAVSGSHLTYGIDGLQAPTLPPPGFHYIMYNVWYNPTTLKDNNGDTVRVDTDIKVFASVQRFVYTTNIKILGAEIGRAHV
jgi:hypothetical protein